MYVLLFTTNKCGKPAEKIVLTRGMTPERIVKTEEYGLQVKMKEQIELFLSLENFDEYMEKYEQFCGLPMGKETFRKEMQLMEKDAVYTHREKETIRDRRKRAVLKKLHGRIDELREAVEKDGVWMTPVTGDGTVEIRYRYPNGREGDIAHYLAGMFSEPEEITEEEFRVELSAKDYRVIALLAFPMAGLFKENAYDPSDEALTFLLRYNRIAQIEQLMRQVNYYREKYRSLRSIPDLPLKRVLQGYHQHLEAQRNEIYEKLIQAGRTHPRWKSEQKAYAIVKKYYADAKFQYQPWYLFGQRLDIYIPSRRTAIEYQGKQHYEPIAFFGGMEGLLSNQERDRRKRWRCQKNDVRMLYWDYDQPLTESWFAEVLVPQIEGKGEGEP